METQRSPSCDRSVLAYGAGSRCLVLARSAQLGAAILASTSWRAPCMPRKAPEVSGVPGGSAGS